MTFLAFETSQESGRPAELFDFRIGLDSFKFTSWGTDVTVALGTFNAVTIKRSRLSQELTTREGDVEVTVPADNAFVTTYNTLGITGGRPTLTLYRTHVNDPDQETPVFFRGDVTNLSRGKDARSVKIHVTSVLKSQDRQVPRQDYKGLCNHALYDARCTISETNPSFEKFLNCSAVTADGLTLTLDGAGAFGADFFEAGFVEFGADFRMVVDQGGAGDNEITIRVPFENSPLNQTVRALAGCKHRLVEDCQDKFNNVDNYGGTPFVPLKKIFESGVT